YLDELVACLAEYGVPAITYMPTRNTDEQLARLRGLCEKHGLMQISGEDVNSPRQSFRIEKMCDAQFANLIDSTWELIRHENK
ncbi:MAG: PHP domain-containing protein, partial [Oscillospiraceae bacterium]|nr:PHP domain-containing protein [Oscillospiraceae bacterium]